MSNREDPVSTEDESDLRAGESSPQLSSPNEAEGPRPAADSGSPVVLNFSTTPGRLMYPSVDGEFMLLETDSEEQIDSVPLGAGRTPTEEDEIERILCLLEAKFLADEPSQHLLRTLRRLLPEYRTRLNFLTQKVAQLEEQVKSDRQESLRKQEVLLEQHSQRLNHLAENYVSRHALVQDRAANSRAQVDGLSLQLAHAQAELQRQEEKLSLERERLVEEHSQQLQALQDKNDQLQQQLATLQAERQSLESANEDLRRENLELRAKLETEMSTVLDQKDQLEGDLERQESHKQDLLTLLEHERGLNRELSSSMSHQQEQIVILEERLQAALVDLKHKDRLLEAVRTEAFRKTSAALDPSGRRDLLRLIALSRSGSSKSPNTDGSTKADSGIQGMLSADRSRTDASTSASQASPKRTQSLDRELAELRLRQEDADAEVLRAKRRLRNTTDELVKLARLTAERTAQLKHLGQRVHTPAASLSTPGGYEYRSESANPQEFRTGSSGFVPSSARPFSRTVRKVGRRRPPNLSSTPEESLNSLADVSSIRNTADAGNRRAGSPSEELSRASDDVFEPESAGATPCRQFGVGVQRGSAGRNTAARGVVEGTVQDDRKSRRDRVDEECPGLKTISRSPWLRGDGVVKKRPVFGSGATFGGNIHGGVWGYVPPTQDGATRRPTASGSNRGWEGRAARRSLSFSGEPPWDNTAAAPFVFCTTAPPANGGTKSGSQEIGFQTQSLPTPVYLNVHVHSHHVPRDA
ncbi:centrosome-associated protein CEP250 [Ixodes scapularis]|uniref:centrosome-associated protein CEP250 n=1 Tax=Ixodes scapularis TaxID=6945 RepID=UPI001A9FCF27|nr:centrosome-associated protein CEP250 [Ixodes scapularis]